VYIKSSNKKYVKGLCEIATRERRYYHKVMKRIAKNEKKERQNDEKSGMLIKKILTVLHNTWQ